MQAMSFSVDETKVFGKKGANLDALKNSQFGLFSISAFCSLKDEVCSVLFE